MLAVTIEATDAERPLDGLAVGERPEPELPDGWELVEVRAAALNHHDLWALRGVGPATRLPRVLGSDAAGVDSAGNEVVVHAMVGDPDWDGDELLDPRAAMLSDHFDGTFAERVAVPRRNLVRKPAGLDFAAAACLPTAWLTAYRSLFDVAELRPGATLLVQGAGGGLATAAIALGRAAGIRVWATGRSEAKRRRAVELGADAAFEPGARLPERADAVLESVGEATWAHSVRAVRPGGTVVVAGMTTGGDPPAGLERMYTAKLRVVGTAMGTRAELERLVRFCEIAGVAPPIHARLPLARAREGFEAMAAGELFGKVVLEP
ncbi:MAG: zinc-binding dehydrogenase [Solirubrobacterales bacterium]|nr:zinc-binding dehydrogenase [Solirubrobacterales bacterium]